MSFQLQIPGLFSPEQGALPYLDQQPASSKQIDYATALARRAGIALPTGLEQDRAGLSAWIDAHKAPRPAGRFSLYPSSRQVAFAERIARIRRRDIPRECFRDKGLMSAWIDSNKPSRPVSSRQDAR